MSVITQSRRWFASSLWAKWSLCGAINLGIIGYFAAGLVAPASSIKTAWLPGETTHGHHQIEMDCNACHQPSSSGSEPSSSDVMQDACIRCHGDQLKVADDTHPAKKFRDPVNAALLATLDAQNCLTCHQEHLPERTSSMGLSIPVDYCWHCHEDVGESRPSHVGMKHDSCATAGCHNYHDNRALYEKFLDIHHGEMDVNDEGRVPPRDTMATLQGSLVSQFKRSDSYGRPLMPAEADMPETVSVDDELMTDWAGTAHALAGVNCTACHQVDDDVASWSNEVGMQSCAQCHEGQTESFGQGKHGMRLAVGLSPMTPSLARLPMHAGAAHAELDCNACHQGHRFDTQYAAAEACLKCHADDHSLAYMGTAHAEAWQAEVSGLAAAGTGVSCATCHLPRLDEGDGVWVNHDQNAGLRPNEIMARQVCLNCHGLEFSLSSLADPLGKEACYGEAPETRTESVEMAHSWFEEKKKKAEARRARSRKAN
ncbi:MAG: cytochrome c3 family protein [Planctomycetota bacterium]